MLKLEYRLAEREVKRVLQKGSPFFAYNLVVNSIPNKKNKNRFAIVIGAKSVKLAVHRNFLRRRFYDMMTAYLDSEKGRDIVFVIKKKSVFNLKNKEDFLAFERDLDFLCKKIFK